MMAATESANQILEYRRYTKDPTKSVKDNLMHLIVKCHEGANII